MSVYVCARMAQAFAHCLHPFYIEWSRMETEIHLKRTHDFSHAGSQLRNVIAAARVQLRGRSA